MPLGTAVTCLGRDSSAVPHENGCETAPGRGCLLHQQQDRLLRTAPQPVSGDPCYRGVHGVLHTVCSAPVTGPLPRQATPMFHVKHGSVHLLVLFRTSLTDLD